jgi:hypothetical protein
MLSKVAAEYLSSLGYRADAERKVCFLPFAGIYWEDEIPDLKILMKLPETDRHLVFRLFSIRQRIWDRQDLDSDDQQFWDEVRVQVPDFALFQRLDISAADRDAQNRVMEETDKAMAAWISDADQADITPGKHSTTFSLTYDLTKKK